MKATNTNFSLLLLFLCGTLNYIPVQASEEICRPRVLEFEAKWCKYCQQVRPHVQRLKKKYKNKIEVVQIDIDDPNNRKLMKEYGVCMLPTLIFEKTTSESYMILGSSSNDEIERDVRLLLKK